MNLPIALTALRIFLVPVLVVLLLTRTEDGLLLGTAVFGLAVLTDYLDGYFARRRNQVTRLGIILDPLADKLLTAAAFLSLVEMGLAPAWMVTIILGRELAVTGLRNLALSRGLVMAASPLGKAKMVSQVVAIFLQLLGRPLSLLQPLAVASLWVALGVTVLSGVDYFWRYFGGGVRNEKGPAEGRARESGARA